MSGVVDWIVVIGITLCWLLRNFGCLAHPHWGRIVPVGIWIGHWLVLYING